MHDPATSRAVLIAVDDYVPAEAPGPTPGVAGDVEEMSALLTDPALLGLTPEHCTVLRNPPDAAAVLDTVYEAAAAATGAFILYIVGYTLAAPRHPDLYFALPGSSESRLYRALRYPDVAALVRDTGRAADRIIILDYCYDGEVPAPHSTGPAALEAVAGASVLAASAKDAKSWGPSGQRMTALTGALVRTARSGVPDSGDDLDLAALHHHLGRDLASRQLPAPRLWPGQGERRIVLLRNTRAARPAAARGDGGRADGQAGAQTGTAPGAASAERAGQGPERERAAAESDASDRTYNDNLPKVPEGQDAALTMAPAALADWTAQLRTSGWPQVADEVLAGVAARGVPPNVALLLVVLRMAGRTAEADQAEAIVLMRAPDHFAEIALSLVQSGYREECARLLAQAARRPVDQIRRLARALTARGGKPQAALLFAEATGHAPDAAALEPLLELLPDLGAAHEVGPILAEATTHWQEGRVLTLAEQLEAGGVERCSYALYARAAQLAAGNWPPDRFAALLRRMSAHGAQDEIDTLLGAAEKAVGPFPSLTAYLATDLASADLSALAYRLLSHAVPAYSDVELVALSSYLEAGRQRDLAVHAYATAALSRPPSATVGYIDVLRRHREAAHADKLVLGVLNGRPGHIVGLLQALRSAERVEDAERVVRLATQAPVGVAAAVARELWESGAEQDAARVLDVLAGRPLVELASALVALAVSGSTAALLDAQLRARSPQEYIDAVSVLRTARRDEEADLLFAALGRGAPQQVCAAVLALTQAGRHQDAASLLDSFAAQAPPIEAVEAMALLAESRQGAQAAGELLISALATRPDPSMILGTLRRVRASDQTDRYLEHLGASMPPADLVVLASNLATRGCDAEADLILTRAARRDDFTQLRAAFHEAGRHAQAYHLTERHGEY
ncbi:caspase, EACC1-associated type [Actinocrinis puniceicyclus]|uniref:caspase, EACC1-associated type n=1 Tax=Actinocrinis puniceicyclus TaxID=977794 RepID=UPI003F68B7AB